MNKPTRNPPSAFTLIELLVAIAVSALLLTLISYIFNDTSRAVGRGAHLSQILTHSRIASDQLFRDAKYMVGPANDDDPLNPIIPGFMVILNHYAGDTDGDGIEDPGEGLLIPTGDQYNEPRDRWQKHLLRSDQLVFFREAQTGSDRLQSLTPGSTGKFDSDAAAGYARVWYGIVLRTDADGTGPLNAMGGAPNATAIDLVLGRQALLLAGGTSGLTGVVTLPGQTSDLANSMYAEPAALSDSTRFDLSPVLNSGASGSPKLFQAMTDVMNLEFNALLDSTYPGPGPLYEWAGMLEPILPLTPISNLPTTAYKQSAYTWAYAGVGERLRTNPTPPQSLLAWNVGQQHTWFVPHTSEFIIDFAADIVDDLPTGTPDGAPDREPDEHPALSGTDSLGRAYAYDAGIKWYSHFSNNPTDGAFDSTKALTWGIPTTGFHSGVTSYPPYDASPQLPGSVAMAANAAFVFGHTKESAKWWPYMLRVRYRLHDRAGNITARDPITRQTTIAGRWFEQILRVPHPENPYP